MTLTSHYNDDKYIDGNIISLDSFTVKCWADYGIKSFELVKLNNKLRANVCCHGIKPSYTSPINIKTAEGKCDDSNLYSSSFPCLIGILVGSKAKENNVDIGFPLRGFKYVVKSSGDYKTIYYEYSYSKLRNMKLLQDEIKETFKQLRDNNSQKD